MKKILHSCLWIVFILYGWVVMDLLLLGRGVITDASPWEHISSTSNFLPFKTIWEQIEQYLTGENRGFALRNLGGNFFLLFPIGCALPCLFASVNRLWKVALGMTLFISVAELLQGLLCIGFIDIDDLLFNLLGGVAGYLLVKTLLIWRIFCRLGIAKGEEH